MRVHLTDRNLRRAITLALFIGALYLFRHLAVLFVFFVLFQRSIGLLAGYAHKYAKIPFKVGVIGIVLLFLGSLGLTAFLATRGIITNLDEIRGSADQLIALIQASPYYQQYAQTFDHGGIIDRLKDHGTELMHYASLAGRNALYLMIALIISVVFLLERDEITEFRKRIPVESIPRVILRFLGHVTDAVAITFRLQFVVAVVNAIFTLPVLLVIGMPGIPALMTLLVVSGLVPVVGGVVAGGVLMAIAFITKGYFGLVVFIVWTFILHKLESYVLTPRLTAQHVRLPSFVIVVSLLLFEHVFGLAGLFLSFPSLFVASRIREGWLDPEEEARADDRTERALRGQLPTFFGGEYIQQ